MKRFIVLASLAAFMVALPAAHLSAAPQKKKNVKTAFCVTGKNQKSGHIIKIPRGVAKRLQTKGIGCTRFIAKKGSNECFVKKCKHKKPPKK